MTIKQFVDYAGRLANKTQEILSGKPSNVMEVLGRMAKKALKKRTL